MLAKPLIFSGSIELQSICFNFWSYARFSYKKWFDKVYLTNVRQVNAIRASELF